MIKFIRNAVAIPLAVIGIIILELGLMIGIGPVNTEIVTKEFKDSIEKLIKEKF